MSEWPGDAARELTTFGGLSRAELMSRVKSTGNQTTEIRLAKLLSKEGLTGWRRHKNIPGRPDFIWPKVKVAVFVDGCFWHGHNCGKNIRPKTNAKAWLSKIERNKTRDREANRLLRQAGWKVIRVWECNLKNTPNVCLRKIRKALEGQSVDS